MKAFKSWRLDPTQLSPKAYTLTAIVIFSIAAALLLNRSLLPGYTLLPLDIIQDIKPWDHFDLGPRANRLLIDPFFIFYPNRFLQTAAIQNGQLMLWNPYLFTGTPVIADPNFQPFYLPNLLFSIILPVNAALPWLAWIHLTFTGLFMYLFLRKKALNWFAAVLGGGTWLLNGYLIVWLENPHRLSTAAWFPAIFWAFEIAVQEGKVRWAAAAGLFFGLAILGGQIQFIFFFSLILTLYVLMTTYYRFKDGLKRTGEPVLYFFLISIIGLSIGALVIISAAEFSTFSQRTLVDGASILNTSWPAQQLITLIAPDFYGNPSSAVNYWGAINYAEVTTYFGIISLLMAVSAVFVARDKRFLHITLILFAVILVIALGTPLVRLLTIIPGFQFLALRRSLILIPFLGSWLAAIGFDGWLRDSLSTHLKIIALTVSITILTAVTLVTLFHLDQTFLDHHAAALPSLWRALLWLVIAVLFIYNLNRWPNFGASILILLAIAELLQWGSKFNPIISTDFLYPENAVVNFLEEDDSQFRVLPLQANKAIFGPNILSIFGIETITGYSSLIKGDYADLLRSLDNDIEIGWMRDNENILVMSHFHNLVSMLNVKYVLSSKELNNHPELFLEGQFDGVWIYKVEDAANRAFLVSDVQVAPIENTLSTILSESFDWKNSATITQPLPLDQKNQLNSQSKNVAGSVAITNYTPNKITASVKTVDAAFLVLADAYYPGWQAEIDGQPTHIYQTNLVLRGVFVPPGSHEISFQFDPITLKIGLLLAIIGISAAMLIIYFERRYHFIGAFHSSGN